MLGKDVILWVKAYRKICTTGRDAYDYLKQPDSLIADQE